MKIGELRHIIVLQTPTMATDAYGASRVQNWQNFATLYARITPTSMKQLAQGGSTEALGQYTVLTRYIDGVEPTMTIYWPAMGKRFEIVSVMPDSELTHLTFRANEIN